MTASRSNVSVPREDVLRATVHSSLGACRRHCHTTSHMARVVSRGDPIMPLLFSFGQHPALIAAQARLELPEKMFAYLGMEWGFTCGCWFHGFGLVLFGAPGPPCRETAQKFALCFSLSRRKICSLLPSLGVFSWNFGGVFEAPGPSNVHVWSSWAVV